MALGVPLIRPWDCSGWFCTCNQWGEDAWAERGCRSSADVGAVLHPLLPPGGLGYGCRLQPPAHPAEQPSRLLTFLAWTNKGSFPEAKGMLGERCEISGKVSLHNIPELCPHNTRIITPNKCLRRGYGALPSQGSQFNREDRPQMTPTIFIIINFF